MVDLNETFESVFFLTWYVCQRDGVERQTTSQFLNEAQFHSQVLVFPL